MLPVARWLMQGLPQAMIGAALSSLVPWLFWLGASIAALVTLRKGLASALPVIMAAAVPAGWWWSQGDVVPLASILLVTLMAVVLRARMRWSEALIVGALGGALMIQLGSFTPPGSAQALLDQLQQGAPQIATMLDDMARQGVDTQELATLLMGGVTGLVVLMMSVACLALARAWQAGLYNPGGFREEFHALRLMPRELLVLFVVGLAGVLFDLPGLGMLIWIPLLVAGIALVHGVIGLKGMHGIWLGVFYVMLVFTWPMILIVLLVALLDSFVNIRARLGSGN
ncbi:hypothetical protein OM427_07985 [Halomonas sp. 18H]|uniref:hypothetical protein n=1 Tax=Halomonas almeriensis TaxID=308163 RepID=UPI0022318BD9|nr:MULTISPECIES: hypothetical protein [Halomonas]MCW4149473.1 hypothetical protein [Halomonas sp. 18H]MDN3553581.1 hypothetical protein [Halomonas almeriensis]